MTMHNQHKINYRRLLNVIGGLLWVEALFMCAPTLTAFLYGERDFVILLVSTIITALGAIGLRSIPVGSTRMGKREGYLLTASVWVVFSLFGSIPFIYGSSHLSFSRAFFEAMSGFTTTGTSAVAPGVPLSHGILLWQGLMQWLGGMGIIIFTLAVIPTLNNSGGMLMYNAESTGITHDKLRPRISQTARTLWGTYLGITIVLTALLWLGPLDFFDSICFAFGTVSTGGFSPTGASPTLLGSTYVTSLIIVFMFLGGVSFGMIYKCFTGAHRSVWHSEVFRLYLLMIAVFSAIFITVALVELPFSASGCFLEPVFQVVSVITSTGYSVNGFPYGLSFVMALTLVMMLTGPCAGSTGGGVKLDRIVVLMRSLGDELKRIVRPNAVASVKLDGKVIPQHLVHRTMSFLCLFVMVAFAGGTLLTLLGLPLESAMVAAVSCICNTGFAPEIAGFDGQFFIMTEPSLWVLSILMLVGRLEIFTILILLTRTFWR